MIFGDVILDIGEIDLQADHHGLAGRRRVGRQESSGQVSPALSRVKLSQLETTPTP